VITVLVPPSGYPLQSDASVLDANPDGAVGSLART
jgi:hypothetical protein